MHHFSMPLAADLHGVTTHRPRGIRFSRYLLLIYFKNSSLLLLGQVLHTVWPWVPHGEYVSGWLILTATYIDEVRSSTLFRALCLLRRCCVLRLLLFPPPLSSLRIWCTCATPTSTKKLNEHAGYRRASLLVSLQHGFPPEPGYQPLLSHRRL